MRVGRIAQMTERQRWFNLRAVGLQAASSYKCFGCLLVVEDMYQIDPHLLVGTWPKKTSSNRQQDGNRYKVIGTAECQTSFRIFRHCVTRRLSTRRVGRWRMTVCSLGVFARANSTCTFSASIFWSKKKGS